VLPFDTPGSMRPPYGTITEVEVNSDGTLVVAGFVAASHDITTRALRKAIACFASRADGTGPIREQGQDGGVVAVGRVEEAAVYCVALAAALLKRPFEATVRTSAHA